MLSALPPGPTHSPTPPLIKLKVLEGEARARNVVIEWPDSKTAHEFYTSPDYSEALSYGIPAATRDYIIVEGP